MLQAIKRVRELGAVPLDFLLVPLGLFFFEASVLISDVVRDKTPDSLNDFLVHLLHYLLLIVFGYSVLGILKALNISRLKFIYLVFLGMLLAVFSEITFTLLYELLDTENKRGIALSMRSVFFLGVIWFPIVVIISSHFRRIPGFINEFEHTLLINARIKLRESHKNSDAERKIKDEITTRLINQTSELARQISAVGSTLDKASVESIQELLRNNKLRRLSAELESRGNKSNKLGQFAHSMRKLNIFARQIFVFLNASLKSGKIPTYIIFLTFILGVSPALLNTLPPSKSLPALLVIALLVLFLCNLPELIAGKNKPVKISWRLFSYLLICFSPLMTNVAGQALFPTPDGRIPFIITMVNFPLFFAIELAIAQVLTPIFSNKVSELAYIPSSAILRLKLVTVQAELEARLSHQWAVFIHGKILTRFATNSLRIQQALDANDAESFKKIRAAILDLLQNPTAEFNSEKLDLSAELSTRVDPWIGILDVDLRVEEQLKSFRNDRVQEIGEVVEEILSNSVRHGGSTEIKLEVTKSDANTILIRAIDNPTKSPDFQSSSPGLGTKIFNVVSDGRWKIEQQGNETVFTIYISVNG
jgi:two-component sensor histidine kinase